MGSGNRHVDNDGEPDQETNLPLHRPVVARRARFVGRRRVWRILSRNIFASLSVPRLPSNYHVSAQERSVRALVFRGHTRHHEHFKCHIDGAFFRNAWLQYGPAHQPAGVLASYRRPQRDGAFKPQHYSAGILHAVYPEFQRRPFSGKDCPNYRCYTYASPHFDTNADRNPDSNANRYTNTNANANSRVRLHG